ARAAGRRQPAVGDAERDHDPAHLRNARHEHRACHRGPGRQSAPLSCRPAAAQPGRSRPRLLNDIAQFPPARHATACKPRGCAMLIEPDRSHLLLIDLQEKLVPAVTGHAALVKNAGILLRAAAIVGVPATLSEQYPKGLGSTVAELSALAGPETPRLAKVEFSCARNAALRDRIEGVGRDQLVVGGAEAHICVLQTAVDLA